jgi:hypothetical protein
MSVCNFDGQKNHAAKIKSTQFKPIINVSHGHGMQFEMFYSLGQSLVAGFAHLHQVGFHPTFPIMGKHLWW